MEEKRSQLGHAIQNPTQHGCHQSVWLPCTNDHQQYQKLSPKQTKDNHQPHSALWNSFFPRTVYLWNFLRPSCGINCTNPGSLHGRSFIQPVISCSVFTCTSTSSSHHLSSPARLRLQHPQLFKFLSTAPVCLVCT